MEVALQKGSVQLTDDRIIISDKEKRLLNGRRFSSIIWIIYAVFAFMRYAQSGEEFLFWSGVIIGPAHLLVLIMLMLRSSSSEVFLSEIQAVSFKKRMGKQFLNIKLRNGRNRRISNIDPCEEPLRTYFQQKQLAVSA
jgi:hypothetical protein